MRRACCVDHDGTALERAVLADGERVPRAEPRVGRSAVSGELVQLLRCRGDGGEGGEGLRGLRGLRGVTGVRGGERGEGGEGDEGGEGE